MIRVLLVNEVRLVSNVIAALLEGVPDIQAVGTATTIDEALAQFSRCDVMLVSARLPDDGALRLTRAVAATQSAVRVLILGLNELRERVLQFVEAGAAGYVLKDDSVDDLLDRIRAAHAGRALVSPEVTAALIERVSELARQTAEPSEAAETVGNEIELTSRELEILKLIGDGLTNQAIADQLCIEVGTVKNHVHNILQKLNVSSRRDAAGYLSSIR